MFARRLAVLSCFIVAPALAQAPATRADLEAQKAVVLTKADLETLLPGAKDVSVAPRTGSQRDLSLMASGRIVGQATGGQNQGYTKAEGKWNVSDDGKFCVNIAWTWGGGSADEKWCATLYKLGDDYYAVTREGPTGVAWKHKITK